jgi:hypothetical protein
MAGTGRRRAPGGVGPEGQGRGPRGAARRRRRAGIGVRVVLGCFALPVCGSRRLELTRLALFEIPQAPEPVDGSDEASRLPELVLADDGGGAVE